MISLSILELLYLVLIFFTTIIGTLLVVILIRVMKVVRVASELAEFYFKIKEVLGYYAQIPDMIKDKVSDIISSKNQKEEE